MKTDGAQNGNWLVSDGLAAGDKVIVAGVQKVKEGAPAVAAVDPGARRQRQAPPGGAAPAAGKAPADAQASSRPMRLPAATDSNKQ